MFCYTPAMLLIDTTPLRVVQIAITAFIGVFAVASALEGYCFARMHMITRIVIAAGGLMLIHPALLTDVIGIAVVVAILVFNRVVEKKQTAAAA